MEFLRRIFARRALPKLALSSFTASLLAGVGPLVPGAGLALAPPAGDPLAQPLSHAVLYNVFWDPDWNRDLAGTGLATERISDFVRRLASSEYFGGLRQYGVNSPRFAATLPVVPACGSIAPQVVTPKQLAAFAECEAHSLHLPSNPGGRVIDIFLPPTTTQDYP
ncbi:MAG: hypothetical protein K6U87_16195, partial [Firmicutes bacterium]|nr:hypothetical protein [Bacillota bacterium]